MAGVVNAKTKCCDGNDRAFLLHFSNATCGLATHFRPILTSKQEADRSSDGDYVDGNQTDIRNYANWDANFNVTSLSVVGDYDFDGSFEAYPMAQRMTYDAYGGVQFVDLAIWNITVINSFAWSFLHQGGKREGTGNYSFRHRDYSVSR